MKLLYKNYSNEYGLYDFKGLRNGIKLYYLKNRALYFTDEILINRMIFLERTVFINIDNIISALMVMSAIEILKDIINEKPNLLTSSIGMILSVAITIFLLKVAINLKYTKDNYLFKIEIEIIKDILESE